MKLKKLINLSTLITLSSLCLYNCGKETSSPSALSSITITGSSINKYLLNSTVEAIDINSKQIISNTITGDYGQFNLTVPNGKDYLLKVCGGYLDEDGILNGNEIKNNYCLYNFIPSDSLSQYVIVSPLSTYIVAKSLGKDPNGLLNKTINITSIDLTNLKSKINNILNNITITRYLPLYVQKGKEKQIIGIIINIDKSYNENFTKMFSDLDNGNYNKFIKEIDKALYNYTTRALNIDVKDINNNKIENANVEIQVIDKDGNEFLKKNLFSKNGVVSHSLEIIYPATIKISVSKDGYITTTKSITYNDPSDIPRTVSIKLDIPQSQVILDSNNTSISKASSGYIKLYIVKNIQTNQRKILINQVPLLKANEEKVTFSMEIPPNIILGKKIKATINNYDPSNKTQAEMMPTWEDSNGNRLKSVAFDYINLIDLSTGRAVSLKTTKDIDSEVYIIRNIKCSLLDKDADPNKEGYQVPVYILKNGKWVRIGNGVIINSFDDESIKPESQVCKDTNEEYVLINITNEDFKYINLDYPISGTTEVPEKCTKLKFIDSEGNPISSLYVDLYDDDYPEDFYYTYGTTDSNGEIILKAVYYNSTSNDTTGIISYYNPYTYISLSKIVNLTDCDLSDYQKIIINKPKMCDLNIDYRGKQGYLYAYSSDYTYYKWTELNEGINTIEIPCNSLINLEIKGKLYKVNIDGNLNYNETLDDGHFAEVIVIPENIPPYAWLWLENNQYEISAQIPIYVYVFDEEGDFPITTKIEILDTNGNEKYSQNMSITSDLSEDGYFASKQVIINTTLKPGIYKINLEAIDSKGNSRNLKDYYGGLDYLPNLQIIDPTNNPPSIDYSYVNNDGKNLIIYMSASDVDNDLQKCNVEILDEDGNSANITFLKNQTTLQPSYCYIYKNLFVYGKGNYTIKFEAIDEKGNSIKKEKTIEIISNPISVKVYTSQQYNIPPETPVYVEYIVKSDDILVDNYNYNITLDNQTLSVCNKTNRNCFNVNKNKNILDIYTTIILPDNNQTDHDVCLEGKFGNDQVSKCIKLYKKINENSSLNITIE